MGSHDIKQGDPILLRRKKPKHAGMYDPEPYLVVKVDGTQIKGAREGQRDKTSGTQRWKKFKVTDTVLKPIRHMPATAEELNIGVGLSIKEILSVSPMPLCRTYVEKKCSK